MSEELKNNSNSSSPKKPDDEDDEDHPHGIYKGAGYHHKNSCGNKSPCPDDGQNCLDFSIPSVGNQRIAIEGNQFVVLKQTSPRKFHGYKVKWDDLDPNIRNILTDAKLVTKNGKIIKRIIEKKLKMNNTAILFPLTNAQKIIITLEEPLTTVGWCYEENIVLLQEDTQLLIADGPIYYNMQQLIDLLTKVLNNNLPLHESITSDIGYLLNEYHNNKTGFIIKEFANGLSAWIGYEYFLWQAQNNNISYSTWLYNDANQNIILEITSLYPYFYCDIKKEANYITYKNWIKTYQPYIKLKLSQKTALQWLEQAEYIVKTIEDNIARWRKESESKKQ